jgi:hypothetical protein
LALAEEIHMPSMNEESRKIKVTVTVEEFDTPKSSKTNSTELWDTAKASLSKRLIDACVGTLRQLFWGVF